MKKLIYIFVALFAFVLVSGCAARKNTIRYENGDNESEVSEEADTETSEETTEAAEANEADTEAESDAESDETASETAEPTGKLAVTSFDGAYLKTNLSYNVAKGTVPSGTKKITVNDYELQMYIPGQTQWSYIASTRFNTLKNGLNSYVLKTYDTEDKQTDSLMFSISYEAPIIPTELPGVGSSHWIALFASLILAGFYSTFRKFRWL